MIYLSYLIPLIAVAIACLMAYYDVWKYERVRYQTIDGVRYKKGKPDYRAIAELEHTLLDPETPFDHTGCARCTLIARAKAEVDQAERKYRRDRAMGKKWRERNSRPSDVPSHADFETIDSFSGGPLVRVWRWREGGQEYAKSQVIDAPQVDRIYI